MYLLSSNVCVGAGLIMPRPGFAWLLSWVTVYCYQRVLHVIIKQLKNNDLRHAWSKRLNTKTKLCVLAKSDSAFSSPALKEEREGRGRSMGVRSLNNTLVLTNTQVCWFSHERESFHTFFFANPVPILFTLPFDFRLLKAKPLRCRVQ